MTLKSFEELRQVLNRRKGKALRSLAETYVKEQLKALDITYDKPVGEDNSNELPGVYIIQIYSYYYAHDDIVKVHVNLSDGIALIRTIRADSLPEVELQLSYA